MGTPEAAFFNFNDTRAEPRRIAELVTAGYLVRARADIETLEARSADTSLQSAALASGAQFVSTDYLVANPAFGTGYVAALPGRSRALQPARRAPLLCGGDGGFARGGVALMREATAAWRLR